MDFSRLWKRNLGRDDRVVSDHGREARFPYLDENVVTFLHQLPLQRICDLSLPKGIGYKKLLRHVGKRLGLTHSTSLVKRAIQFGTRIANEKEMGLKNTPNSPSYSDINGTTSILDLLAKMKISFDKSEAE